MPCRLAATGVLCWTDCSTANDWGCTLGTQPQKQNGGQVQACLGKQAAKEVNQRQLCARPAEMPITTICKACTDTPAESCLKLGPSLCLQQLQCFWMHFQLCWLLPLQPHVPSFALTQPSAYTVSGVATFEHTQSLSCLLTIVSKRGKKCS